MNLSKSNLLHHLNSLGLSQFQIDSLSKTIIDYLMLNQQEKAVRPSVCPCCESEAKIYKRGKRNKIGKQRYSCCKCGEWFVYDIHQITFHSHQSYSKWCIAIVDTLNLVPLRETAAQIDVSEGTAFNMRHKLLHAMEELMSSFILEDVIEADETYLLESQKGSKHCTRKPRKRGGKASVRGLSKEQCCVLVAVQRNGDAYAKHIGYGKPKTTEIKSALEDIVIPTSDLITDKEPAYNKLANDKSLNHFKVGHHTEYTSLLHINTVNSLHSRFKSMITQYRGIASHYLNHYCALLTFIRKFQDMDNIEKLSASHKIFKNEKVYFGLKSCIARRFVNCAEF